MCENTRVCGKSEDPPRPPRCRGFITRGGGRCCPRPEHTGSLHRRFPDASESMVLHGCPFVSLNVRVTSAFFNGACRCWSTGHAVENMGRRETPGRGFRPAHLSRVSLWSGAAMGRAGHHSGFRQGTYTVFFILGCKSYAGTVSFDCTSRTALRHTAAASIMHDAHMIVLWVQQAHLLVAVGRRCFLCRQLGEPVLYPPPRTSHWWGPVVFTPSFQA